jgi:hypothetical protein
VHAGFSRGLVERIIPGTTISAPKEVTVRLWRRKHPTELPDRDSCDHRWRLRDVSVALPGPYVCVVCDLCGALHIDGPDAITGPVSNVADGAALHLESLPEPSTPPHAARHIREQGPTDL